MHNRPRGTKIAEALREGEKDDRQLNRAASYHDASIVFLLNINNHGFFLQMVINFTNNDFLETFNFVTCTLTREVYRAELIDLAETYQTKVFADGDYDGKVKIRQIEI